MLIIHNLSVYLFEVIFAIISDPECFFHTQIVNQTIFIQSTR